MTTTYYQLQAINPNDHKVEVMFGSFQRNDVKEELQAEREGLKEQGYKSFKIVGVEQDTLPEASTYEGETVTIDTLWRDQAPSFNFELGKEDLLEEALERGYVIPTTTNGVYLINTDYQGI